MSMVANILYTPWLESSEIRRLKQRGLESRKQRPRMLIRIMKERSSGSPTIKSKDQLLIRTGFKS